MRSRLPALALPALAVVLPGGEVAAQQTELEQGTTQSVTNCSGYEGSCWAWSTEGWIAWDYYLEGLADMIRPTPLLNDPRRPLEGPYQRFHHNRRIDIRDGLSQTLFVSGDNYYTREFELEAGRDLGDPHNLDFEGDAPDPSGPTVNYVVGVSSYDQVDYSDETRLGITDNLLLKGALSGINFTTSANGRDTISFFGLGGFGAHRVNLGAGVITFAGQEDRLFITNNGTFNFVLRGNSIRAVESGMGEVIVDKTEGNSFFEIAIGPTEAEAVGGIELRRTFQNREVEHLYPIARTDSVFYETVWTKDLWIAELAAARVGNEAEFNLVHAETIGTGTGDIGGVGDGVGTFNVMNENGATAYFEGDVGVLGRLRRLGIGGSLHGARAVFLGTVAAEEIRVTAGDSPDGGEDATSWFTQDSLEFNSLILDDRGSNLATVALAGSSNQVVRGNVFAEEAGEGTLVIESSRRDAHVVTFLGHIGSSGRGLRSLMVRDGEVHLWGAQNWVGDIQSDTASEILLHSGVALSIENTVPVMVNLKGIYRGGVEEGTEDVRDQVINVLGGGDNTVTFRGGIGLAGDPIPTVNVGDEQRGGGIQALANAFVTRVNVSAVDGSNGEGNSYARFANNVNSDRITLRGNGSNTATLVLNGTFPQAVTGDVVVGDGRLGGVVVVNNAYTSSTAVVFNGVLGASAVLPIKEVWLDRGEVRVDRNVWTSSLRVDSRASMRIGDESTVTILGSGGVFDAGAGNINGTQSGQGSLAILGGLGRTITFGGNIGSEASLESVAVGYNGGLSGVPVDQRAGDVTFNGTVDTSNLFMYRNVNSSSRADFRKDVTALNMVLAGGSTVTLFGRVTTLNLNLDPPTGEALTTFVLGGLSSRANQTVIRVSSNLNHTSGNIVVRLHSGVLNGGESLNLIDSTGNRTGSTPLDPTRYSADDNLLMRFATSVNASSNLLTITASPRSASEVAQVLQLPEGIAGRLVYANQALVNGDPVRGGFHAIVNLGNEPARQLAKQLSVQGDALSAASVIPIDSGSRVIGFGLSRLALLQPSFSYAKKGDTPGGMSSGGSASRAALWVKPFSALLDQESRDAASGYRAFTSGIIAGWELSLSEKSALGALIAYTDTDVDSADSGNSQLEIANYLLGMYGRVARSRHHWEWHVLVGRGAQESSRSIAIGGGVTARGDFDSKHYGAGLLWGRPMEVGRGVRLTPEVKISLSHVISEDYTETGAGSLNQRVEPEAVTQIEARVGARLRHDGFGLTKASRLAPYVRGGVSYDLAGDEASAISRYVGGGTPFVIEGTKVRPFGLDGGLGLVLSVGESVSFDLQYDVRWKEDQWRHSLGMEARVSF